MQPVTLCSCLKQVMESLLLVSGSSEHVGGVWHKQAFQLTEPGTDGTGKWGTSPKHWNLFQRPSARFSLSHSFSWMQTLSFPIVHSFSSVNDLHSQGVLKRCRWFCIGVSYFFLTIKTITKKLAGRWECVTSYLHNTRCLGSSASMSFRTPGWSQQMAGLGLGISRGRTAERQGERQFSLLALTVPLIHCTEVAT